MTKSLVSGGVGGVAKSVPSSISVFTPLRHTVLSLEPAQQLLSSAEILFMWGDAAAPHPTAADSSAVIIPAS